MVKGVNASFVLAESDSGRTLISARSLGDLNVQSMMEKFGGGGHFTSAAAQPEEPLEEVEAKLKKLVKDSCEKLEEFEDAEKIDAINRRDTLF